MAILHFGCFWSIEPPPPLSLSLWWANYQLSLTHFTSIGSIVCSFVLLMRSIFVSLLHSCLYRYQFNLNSIETLKLKCDWERQKRVKCKKRKKGKIDKNIFIYMLNWNLSEKFRLLSLLVLYVFVCCSAAFQTHSHRGKIEEEEEKSLPILYICCRHCLNFYLFSKWW